MVVYYAYRLEEGIDNHRSDKGSASFLQFSANLPGQIGLCRYLLHGLPVPHYGLSFCKMPEPGIEAAPLPSQRLHHPGIFSDRIDFEPVPDNSRILPQCFQFFIRHFRHLMYLKAVECLPVPFPSLQDRLPGQSGLRSFQCQHFKKVLIIMTDSSPFGIVISLHKR